MNKSHEEEEEEERFQFTGDNNFNLKKYIHCCVRHQLLFHLEKKTKKKRTYTNNN